MPGPQSPAAPAAALLFLGFLAGSAAVMTLVAVYDLLDLGPTVRDCQRKKRNLSSSSAGGGGGSGSEGGSLSKAPIPSFLEAMYLYEREIGLGEAIPSTPRNDGFRMPAEWEHHVGCWLLFPWRKDNWAHDAEPAQKAYAHVANAIQRHGNEQVTVGVRSEDWSVARALLNPAVRVVELGCDDAWVRDTGPTFVVKDDGEKEAREVRGVDWGFNAYGGIYEPCERDQLLARKVLEVEGVRRYRAPVVMEGGSCHVDGVGTWIVTEECLVHPSRNPGLTKEEIEEGLKTYLNVEMVIWLELGVFGDEDTNGHVDNLCCFKGPGEVILHWTDDENDPQFERSWSAYIRLTKEVDAKGRALRIHKMPMPGPLFYQEGDMEGLVLGEGGTEGRKVGSRMAASYVNFYLANEAVVVPQFMDIRDEEANELLQLLYPERKVVGVYSKDILFGGGNIHCITQQQPTNQFDAF